MSRDTALSAFGRFLANLRARLTRRATPNLSREPAGAGDPGALSALRDEHETLARQARDIVAQLDSLGALESRTSAEQEALRGSLQQAMAAATRKLDGLETASRDLATTAAAENARVLDLAERLAALEHERDQERDQLRGLQQRVQDTTSRLERADSQIKDLQVRTVEQVREFDALLSTAGERIDAVDGKVKTMGIKIENEQQQVMTAYRHTEGLLRKEHTRMNWAFSVAAVAVLLGVLAGIAQVWNIEQNATLLAGMSKDISSLLQYMDSARAPQVGMRDDVAPQLTPTGAGARARVPAVAAVHPRDLRPAPDTAPAEEGGGDLPDASGTQGNTYGEIPGRERSAVPQYNRQDARQFFEENALYGDINTLPSGVQYRVVRPGSGPTPSLADKVVISYVGMTPDGKIIDETYSGDKPITYSMQDVMPAWRDALLEMQAGAEFEVYVPSGLAHGKGVRKRGMSGFEPQIYLIELQQVMSDAAIGQAQAN
ncbi:MAG: FKBP-type peptidyl-prolyl cis-trans isomerase [Pseudomonadota bacterium]